MRLSTFLKITAVACSTILLSTACTPFTKVQGDSSTLSKINGSWAVLWSGGMKLEGVSPRPTIVFNTGDGSVSGFDGCNSFKGTYTFQGGRLKAKVAGTRKACPSDVARGVSEQINNLFSNGAEVVETSFMGAHVLMLKNNAAELRIAPSDQVK